MKALFFTIACSLFPLFAIACSCAGPLSFCETINLDFNEDILIVEGKKIGQIEHIMEVEILKVYRGEESRSKIRVIGDRGADCLVYTSLFEIGEEVVLALQPNSIETVVGDYFLSGCGLYYFRCNTLLNPLHGETENIAECLEENICACSQPTSTFYPNPSDGMVFTKINLANKSGTDFINVYNISGQRVRQLNIADQNYVGETLELNLRDLAPGVYFVQYSFQQDCKDLATAKIIISP